MGRIRREAVSAGQELQVPFKTPAIATAAQGTLTFSGAVVDGETVTIGEDTYEFKASGDATEGNIKVDVSGGLDADDAVTALVTAVAANTGSVVTAVDGEGNTVVATAKVKGVAGNLIATTETCTNGAWGATKLAGGIDGTVCNKGDVFVDASYIYVATADSTIAASNIKKVAIA